MNCIMASIVFYRKASVRVDIDLSYYLVIISPSVCHYLLILPALSVTLWYITYLVTP